MAETIGQVIAGSTNLRTAGKPEVAGPTTPHPAMGAGVGDWIMHLPIRQAGHGDGAPADPDCPNCRGTAIYRLDLPTWHPRFGAIFECECVAGQRRILGVAKLRKGVGLAEADMSLRWEALAETEALAPAIAAVKRVLLRGWGWVYLGGDFGTGKSLLLKTAVAETVLAGQPAVYSRLAELLRHLRQGFTSGDFDERLEAWRDAKVLCLDEMGRANETAWTREVEGLIFDPRYDSALAEHRTVTIYASNFAAAEMPDWLASRIADGRFEVVNVHGPDMRPMMTE